MSNDISSLIRDRSWFFSLLGKTVLYAFPALGILGALALLALKQYQYLILSIYMIVPIICAPFAYMLIRKKQEAGSLFGDELFKLMVAGFLLCFAFSLTLLYAFEVRPTLYYFAVAAMATLIFIQIFRSKITQGKTAVILLQTIALALNVCWGISLHYFQYVGRTDILLHTYYVNSVIDLGHVTKIIFYDYEPFPLWHIVNAGICMAGGAGFPAYKVMAITGGLVFALLPVAIYLIASKLFKDDRTALIAALIAVFFPDIIIMGVSTIPRIVAEILMVFLVYLLLVGKSRTKYLLIVPIMAAIIMYHSISILFTAVILLVLYVMQMLFVKKEERFVSIWHVVLAVGMTAVYWKLNAEILIQRLINNATMSSDSLTVPRALTQNVPWSELFNYLQYVPAILFILTGGLLLILTNKFSNRAKIFGVAALGFVWISFPGPLLMIGRLVEGFGIDRFAEYTFLILILVAAAGIAGLIFRSGRYGKAALVMLFCVWALLAVSNDWVASDNPLVKRPFYTYYFSEQEITGMDRLVTHATGVLESDYVPNRYYEGSSNEAYTTILEVDVPNMTFVRHGPEDVLLIREGEQDKQRELRVAALDSSKFISKPEGGSFVYMDRNMRVWDTLAGYNRIYDSRAIQAYN